MRAVWRVPLVPVVCAVSAFAACGGSSKSPASDVLAPDAGEAGTSAEAGGRSVSGGRPAAGGREATGGGASGGAPTSGGVSASGGAAPIASGGSAGHGGEAGAADEGGRPDGGTPSEGGRPWLAGGSNGEPAPENCRAVRRQQITGTMSCFITLGCDAAEVSGNCEADATGQYRCNCTDGHDSYAYRVTSPDPLTACDTVDQICGSARAVPEPGRCFRSLEYENIESCEIDEQCQRPIETSDGEAATLSEDRKVTCRYEGTDGSLSCTYYGANLNPREYFLSRADGRTACEALLGFASGRSDRAFTEPRECTVAVQETSTDHCQIAETCTRPLELDDGVLLELRSSQGVGCEIFMSETSCSCLSDLGESLFWTQLSPSDIETCEQALEPCLIERAFELDGSASCERGTQYVEGNTCTTEFECSQPARLHGSAIRAYVDLGLRCQRLDADHPWVCTCTGETISNYEVGATEGWEACDEGAVRCLETAPRNKAVGF